MITKTSLFIALIILLVSISCKKNDQHIYSIFNQSAERYESLVRQLLEEKRLQIANAIIPVLAFDITSPNPKFEHIALIISRFVSYADKENQAIFIQVKLENENQFKPFIAVWKADSKTHYAYKEKAVVPEGIRALKKKEIEFQIGGGSKQSKIKITFYFTEEHIREQFENIRSLFPKADLAPQSSR